MAAVSRLVEYNITEILLNAGYVPSDTVEYPLEGITSAIKNVLGVTPIVKCNEDSPIKEIQICFSTSLELKECPTYAPSECPSRVKLPIKNVTQGMEDRSGHISGSTQNIVGFDIRFGKNESNPISPDPQSARHLPTTKTDTQFLEEQLKNTARALADRLFDTPPSTAVLVPCNVGFHWTLNKDIIYMLDPLGHRIRNDDWKHAVDMAMKMFHAVGNGKKGRSKTSWEIVKAPKSQPSTLAVDLYICDVSARRLTTSLFGFLGALLSELITNWSFCPSKVAVLLSFLVLLAVNLGIAILPRINNFGCCITLIPGVTCRQSGNSNLAEDQ
nr:ribonuclease 2-like isoform X2 [Ipomoea batatas]